MSILIKGIGIPENCMDCPADFPICDLWTRSAFEGISSAFEGIKGNPWDIRHPNCPLIEVPTPHGRLIDADALDGLLADMAKEYPKRPLDSIGGYWIDKFRNMLKAAPAIILEEEGE